MTVATQEETKRRIAEALALPLPDRSWYDREIGRRRVPTERELEVFLAIFVHGDGPRAAAVLGLSPHTVKRHVDHLYTAIGARDRPHAAWLLYPVLRDRYVLPGDAVQGLRVVA